MWYVVFQAMGISDIDKILSDEAFEDAEKPTIPEEIEAILKTLNMLYETNEITLDDLMSYFEEMGEKDYGNSTE